MHQGITKQNILLNIKFDTIPIFKTKQDLLDKWKRTANKWQVRLIYFDKVFVTDYYMVSGLVDKCNRPIKPQVKDVLYSMIMDDVSNMSFNDFCNAFDYDNDSNKALETYKACQKQTQAYYNMFDIEERAILSGLLQDY